jgi:hypothetical protein
VIVLAVFIAVLAVTVWLNPRLAATVLVAPVLGLSFGGFCWALAAVFVPSLWSLAAFAGSVIGATILAGAWALRGS